MLELMMRNEALAAWVQAVGALLAIFAAFLVTHLQARYAQKHEDRRTAERVRSLARLFRLLSSVCQRASTFREHEREMTTLRRNYDDFNYIASEVNKFSLVDAPSRVVMRAMMEYHKVCGVLANETNPEGNPLKDDVPAAIQKLVVQADNLMAEADRLEREGPGSPTIIRRESQTLDD